MIEALKKIFSAAPAADYAQLVKEGAIILDVRSRGEYDSGHIKGSVNISVNQLKDQLSRLPHKDKVIITCCASGIRSASAKSILESSGYQHVHNGGSWSSLQHKI